MKQDYPDSKFFKNIFKVDLKLQLCHKTPICRGGFLNQEKLLKGQKGQDLWAESCRVADTHHECLSENANGVIISTKTQESADESCFLVRLEHILHGKKCTLHLHWMKRYEATQIYPANTCATESLFSSCQEHGRILQTESPVITLFGSFLFSCGRSQTWERINRNQHNHPPLSVHFLLLCSVERQPPFDSGRWQADGVRLSDLNESPCGRKSVCALVKRRSVYPFLKPLLMRLEALEEDGAGSNERQIREGKDLLELVKVWLIRARKVAEEQIQLFPSCVCVWFLWFVVISSLRRGPPEGQMSRF